MNVELWREIDVMFKYKAEKDHNHVLTWIVLIFVFLGAFSTAEKNQELERRIEILEQRQ